MGKFTADVDAWIQKSERLMRAVAQESAQRTVDEAQTPQAKGGRMPVDTSFLRNSCTANIGSMPSGAGKPSEGAASGGDQQIATTIISWKPGQTLYIGWVANYARNMEFRYGFVRMAAQKWQQTVREVTGELKRRAGR